jgi:hypothetical protein
MAMPEQSNPAQTDRDFELLHTVRATHLWLERVDQRATGYFGLDHELGENDDGCRLCHAAAVLEGRCEPRTRESY